MLFWGQLMVVYFVFLYSALSSGVYQWFALYNYFIIIIYYFVRVMSWISKPFSQQIKVVQGVRLLQHSR